MAALRPDGPRGAPPEATSARRSASAPQATSARPRTGATAAFLAGAAFAIDAAAGTALLLYTGQGFLRAAGLLVAMAVGALTAGLWAGNSAGPTLRARWLAAFLLFLAAATGAAAWSALPALRAWPLAYGLAMLVIIALPGYGAGLLLGGFGRTGRSAGVPARAGPGAGVPGRAGAGVGIPAMAGAAAGVLLAGGSLIPRLDAPIVFGFTTALILVALLADWRRAGSTGGAMNGDVVIISGAAHRGQLAFTIARRLAADGARLVLTGRSEGGRALAEELGENALFIAADLLDESAAAAVVDAALARFGRIDALVNTAGGLTHVGTVEDTEGAQLRAELDRNLVTAHNLARAALPALRRSRGAIVNFASPAALRAPASLAAYSAAKAGIVAFTRALAMEEKSHGVRVNAIAPGMMDTDQNRAAQGDDTQYVARTEVAEVVRFLVSPSARAVTGETIAVTG